MVAVFRNRPWIDTAPHDQIEGLRYSIVAAVAGFALALGVVAAAVGAQVRSPTSVPSMASCSG